MYDSEELQNFKLTSFAGLMRNTIQSFQTDPINNSLIPQTVTGKSKDLKCFS